MKKFLNWLFEPFEPKENLFPELEKEPEEKVEELVERKPKKQMFRPKSFDEYIGQVNAKMIITTYINATRERNEVLPHILLSGSAGCGKTTLAKIIAKELAVNFKEIITSSIVDYWILLETIKTISGGILFLDEIHSIDRNVAEKLYTIMEDFTYNGEEIEPFTLIGANTELGEIIKTRKPFVDRFKIPIELEDYTIKDLVIIGKQYKTNIFPNDLFKTKDYLTLALNSRLTPRTLIRLLEATIYFKDINKVLKTFGIIKNSYNYKDLKILEYITLNEKGVGIQGIASFLGTSVANYVFQIENWLLKNGLIIISPRGRKITDNGKKIIKELKEVR